MVIEKDLPDRSSPADRGKALKYLYQKLGDDTGNAVANETAAAESGMTRERFFHAVDSLGKTGHVSRSTPLDRIGLTSRGVEDAKNIV